MSEEFELPELKKGAENVSDEMNIEVVDDTPPEDRNRQPLPKEIVNELENDDLDEYSDKVKKRLSQMKKVWHDERREKERAAREKEEALAFAQRAHQENQVLRQRLGHGEKIFASEMTKAATLEMDTAKNRLKQAYETGDAELIAEAQDKLTDAKLKLRDFQQFKPSLQSDNNAVQPQLQTNNTPQQVVPDRKAEAWRDQNSWFGEDEEMTALALGLHEKLVRSGIDPRSDVYYQQVDSTMRKRFPDYFGEAQTHSEEREEKPAPRKTSTVVAPATRSTAPRSIRLSSSAAAIAKRLGITPEAYARELMKLENNNG